MKSCLGILKHISVVLFLLLIGCSHDVSLKYRAAENLNLSQDEQSLPVMVKIYQLKNNDKFLQASFQQLWRHDDEILASDLLTKQLLVITPGEHKTIELKQHKRAQYIAAVAQFRDREGSQWRVIRALNPHHLLTPTIQLSLRDNRLQWETN